MPTSKSLFDFGKGHATFGFMTPVRFLLPVPWLATILHHPEGGGHAQGTMLGAFVNVEYALSSRWAIVPELSFHRTIHGEVPVDGFVIHLGAGLLWRF